MELKEALLKRRSVRKFTDEPVSEEMIQQLLHAAMSGPSACNMRPWEFYVVRDPETLAALRGCIHFGKMKSKLAIVVCGNLRHALPMQASEFWIQDCSAATENILLQATDLGLGAVWCGVHPQKRPVNAVRKALGIDDEKQIPLNIIHIGHPAEQPAARDQYDPKKVHFI